MIECLKEKRFSMREKLLAIIEKNSRIDIKELAIRLGVEEIDVINELQKLEDDRIICGYHTLVNWEKTSIDKVTALIEVKVTPQRGQGFDRIASRIYNYPEVRDVYLISGGFDLLVTLEEKSLKDIARFVSEKLSTLDSILSTGTHFILKKYKDHGTIIDEQVKDEREVVSP
jgi:DNA-binding Lrp family transcriptional regulator